jgi:phenylalanyl-tRNA synthetase beta chain
MRVPLSWIAELTDVPDRPEELAERLTGAGLECEVMTGVQIPEGVVTAKIVSCEKHPNADRLSVCRVDVGDGELYDIVCGAPNAEAGWVAAAALPGAELGEGFVIQKRKLRGVTSNGMLCSEKELGLSEEASGILLLPADTEVGKPLGEVLATETALVTEPTSNRGDLMSIEGVAREVAATSGRALKGRTPRVDVAKKRPAWKIEIQDPEDCPRYCGRVIEGLTAGPSPAWLADRLAAAGIRPLWNLVDVTNYVLLELGHPLHAFDLEKLAGRVIGVRLAGKGESLTTLDGKERGLTPDTLLITDASGPVAIAGIMGGEDTMITEATTSVFLEGASFGARRVRSGVRALKLITDASGRFERGVDPESVPRALDRCCELLLELCPDARVIERSDSYVAPVKPKRVSLRRTTVRRILGIDVPDDDVRRIFESLDLELKKETKTGWDVIAPTWRPDVTAEEDLVEEVARIWGYDRIPERAVARVSPTPLRHARFENFFNSRRTMLRLGVDEVVTPTLVDGEFEDALLAPDSFFGRSVPLRNPLTADRSHLRSTLLPSLLRVLMTNRAQSLPDLDIYEIGRVFGGSADSQVTERQHLAILLAGLGTDRARGMGAKSCDFFDMKGLLEVYVEQFWESRPSLEGNAPPPLSAERSANVVVDGKVVGCLGEIGPEARKAFDLPPDEPVFLAELDLEIAVGSAGSARFFEALPRYPGVLRDLAFVVPRTCRHAELEAALRDEGGDLLAELRLFDVYEGAPLDEREKSLAYTLVFRSPDRSLTHDEVDGRVDALVKRVGRQLDARLR